MPCEAMTNPYINQGDAGLVNIVVVLPPGSIEHPVRSYDVPANESVGAIEDALAERFYVEKGGWHLYAGVNETSFKLNRDDKMRDFCKIERFYFFPE